jgi:hypothetical protein
MSTNPPSLRFPFNVIGKCEPEVEHAIRNTFNGLLDHENAISALAPQSGNTSQRPTTNIKAGQQFFDTTLGIPVFWTGKIWVNSAGASV